ncbi:uncharacterized protein LOC114314915 [Camellia sinensis]|uniref:uncharacterized protein LOC114314915 n=1 Tax=Camellia sinensis TaxID=4442 RepID=UPI001036EC8E|nr:uncharacterized protein LOC114314915 [Camellia sinensis]
MAAAVVCSQAVFLPIDVMCQPCSYLKVIISWVRTEHEESAPSLWTIVSVQAAGGIFAGAAASCITTPWTLLRLAYSTEHEESAPSLWTIVSVQAAGGIFAGAAASCITTPLDIIKTRLQF